MENIKMTEWREVKLSDLISIKHGYAFKGEFFSEEETPYILVTPGNFNIGGSFKSDKFKWYKGEIPTDYILKKDDLIVTMTDLSKNGDTLGYSALVPELNRKVLLHNQRIGLVEIKSQKIDKFFLYWLMRTSVYQKSIVNTASGSTVKHTSPDRVCQFSFLLPPLDIQRKIAGILGALDDRIDVLRRENVVLEQMAQAVFQSWFVDFDIVRAKAAGTPESEVCEKYHITPELYALFPSALTPDDLPLGWEKKKLGDLAFNASETHTAQDVEKLIFINTSDVKNGVFLHNKYSVRSEMPGQAKKSIKENDILYSEIRPINKHFAFVNFDSKDYIVSTKFMIIRSFDINNVFYIYFFLTLKETLNSFQALAENRSGTFPQITFESISKTEIVFSNRELHWYFSDYLKKTYTKIFENEKQIRALSATRDALLPQLLSGKIKNLR